MAHSYKFLLWNNDEHSFSKLLYYKSFAKLFLDCKNKKGKKLKLGKFVMSEVCVKLLCYNEKQTKEKWSVDESKAHESWRGLEFHE